LPGLVVLDGFRSGAPVKFDGKQVVLPMSREDEGLVESFTSDTTEGMLAAARAGAAVRLLGTDFGPRDETPGIAQPHYDIYDVPITLKIIPAAPERIKRYYFDSKSKLLARTAYTVNDVRVETRFGEWRKIDGSMYPGRVERYEGGQLVFSFIIAKVAAGPQEDGAAFKQ
jgi:hypothetical protein